MNFTGKRRGMALAAALAAITAISVLISGIWVVVDLNAKTGINRRSALHALLLAEGGLSHTLALLRGDLSKVPTTTLLLGSDGLANTADDGLLIGHGLDASKVIPAGGRAFGGGTYYVTLVDDPADGDGNPMVDSNNRILARCRAVMSDGASAEIQAVIGSIPLPAIATEGSMQIGGDTRVVGACGGLHANKIIHVHGNPVVEQSVTASDTVTGSACNVRRPNGSCNTPLHNQPPVDIPALTMAQLCKNPTLTLLESGKMIDHLRTPPDTISGSTARFGWLWAGDKWESDAGAPRPGTICANHDVSITHDWGSSGAPLAMSIYSTRSVIVSGNPTLTAHDPEGGQIVAEGDVEIDGEALSATHNNYSGLIYAGSQCLMRGRPRLKGQLICKDRKQPANHKDWVGNSNLNADVTGRPEVVFDCSGSTFLGKRKVLSWVQKLGS